MYTTLPVREQENRKNKCSGGFLPPTLVHAEETGEEGKRVIQNYFMWNMDPFMGEVPCCNEAHGGRTSMKFYGRPAEKIVDEFEIDPVRDEIMSVNEPESRPAQ